ncbi:ARF7 effector protein C-terminus [Sparganum proliferum]
MTFVQIVETDESLQAPSAGLVPMDLDEGHGEPNNRLATAASLVQLTKEKLAAGEDHLRTSSSNTSLDSHVSMTSAADSEVPQLAQSSNAAAAATATANTTTATGRRRLQVSRKSTNSSAQRTASPLSLESRAFINGGTPTVFSPASALPDNRELDRLKFSNPGKQMRDLEIDWSDGNLTRGFRRQLTLHSQLCERNSSDPGLFDSRGRILPDLTNRCDCLRPDCKGCFLPCRRCHSNMCGPLCRIYRNFVYEEAEIFI